MATYTPYVTMNGGNLTRVMGCATGGGEGDAAQWTVSSTFFDNRQKMKTAVSGNLKKNNIVVTPESDLDSETVDAFLSTNMSISADSSQTIYEDLSVRGNNGGDVTKATVTLTVFGKNQPSNKRKCLVIHCEPNSKGYTAEANKAMSPNIEYVGIKAPRDIWVAASYFPTDLVSGASGITIFSGTIGQEVWLTSAN